MGKRNKKGIKSSSDPTSWQDPNYDRSYLEKFVADSGSTKKMALKGNESYLYHGGVRIIVGGEGTGTKKGTGDVREAGEIVGKQFWGKKKEKTTEPTLERSLQRGGSKQQETRLFRPAEDAKHGIEEVVRKGRNSRKMSQEIPRADFTQRTERVKGKGR